MPSLAFKIAVSNSSNYLQRPGHPSHFLKCHPFKFFSHPFQNGRAKVRATIISWDDSDEDSLTTSSFDLVEEGSDSYTSIDDNPGEAICERLSFNSEKLASLARLAVAFSPKERYVALKDIEHVRFYLSINIRLK